MDNHRRRSPLMGLGLAGVLCCLEARAGFTIVAKTGDVAPGLNDNFARFGVPYINNSGQVLFDSATNYDVITSGSLGVYVSTPGNLQLIAKSGDAPPGSPPGAVLLTVSAGGFSDSGQAVIGGYLDGPGIPRLNVYGYWAGGGNQPLTYIAHKDAHAEGFGPSTTYYWVGTPQLAGGKMLFSGLVANGPPEASAGTLWGGSVDNFGVISRQSPPPDASNFYGSAAASLNAAGQITFIASPDGINNMDTNGLWYGTMTSQSLVLSAGDGAPQIPGKTISWLTPARLNGAGELSFVAAVGPVGPEDVNLVVDDRVLYTGTPGNFKVRARSGQLAPGMPAGVFFGGETDFGHGAATFYQVQQNGNGDIAFRALVSGEGVNMFNNDGIWLGRAGGPLKLIAREGEQAPGAPLGAKFVADDSDLDQFNMTFSDPSINSHGQIVFASKFADENGQMFAGVWATDIDDTLNLIAYEGQEIDVGGGVFKTIGYLGRVYDLALGSASEDGQNFVFNDAGQFVFTAHFTDGTSAVVIAQVPEPGVGMVLVLVGGLAARRFRKVGGR